MKNQYLSEKILEPFLSRLFIKAGVRRSHAQAVSRALVITSLRGVDSHGIRLAAHYLKEVKVGRINIHPRLKFRQTAPAVGTTSPAATRSSVVFPHPEGPTKQMNSPRRASTVTSSTAVMNVSSGSG